MAWNRAIQLTVGKPGESIIILYQMVRPLESQPPALDTPTTTPWAPCQLCIRHTITPNPMAPHRVSRQVVAAPKSTVQFPTRSMGMDASRPVPRTAGNILFIFPARLLGLTSRPPSTSHLLYPSSAVGESCSVGEVPSKFGHKLLP